MLRVESLEARSLPGDLVIPLWMAAVGHAQMSRTVPVDVPDSDLNLISATRDGKPTRFLDYAHDVDWHGVQPRDVGSIDAVIAEIQGRSGRLGRPISVTIVCSSTQGPSDGIIIGTSHLHAGSQVTNDFIDAVNDNQVSSIFFVVSHGEEKGPLFQEIASGLGTQVSAWSGNVGVVDGSPGFFFTGRSSTVITREGP